MTATASSRGCVLLLRNMRSLSQRAEKAVAVASDAKQVELLGR